MSVILLLYHFKRETNQYYVRVNNYKGKLQRKERIEVQFKHRSDTTA